MPDAAMICAVDPGTTQSGFVMLYGDLVTRSGVLPNKEMLAVVSAHRGVVAIEMVASYGMAVGKEVFETVRWLGRFQQACADPEAVKLVYRRDVKIHVCNSSKAKDPNVRQALLDMFPATGGGKTPQIGTKAKPGPLYGVSTHAWAALGVAVTVQSRRAIPSPRVTEQPAPRKRRMKAARPGLFG